MDGLYLPGAELYSICHHHIIISNGLDAELLAVDLRKEMAFIYHAWSKTPGGLHLMVLEITRYLIIFIIG